MKWTRIRVVMMAIVVALGAGTIGAAPAQAADLGSTSVTADTPLLVFSPNPLYGAVGDSFTVINDSGQIIQPDSGGSTGVISHESGGSDCFVSGSCSVSPGASKVFYIMTLGTITFQGGGNAGPLRLEAGGGVTDPALVYPTASIDANGGTCTGSTQYIKYQGQNAASGTFTAPTADTCTRTNFSLAGWARSATGSVEWQPGSTVSIGDEGFTLFAVWRPNGVQITYDANVGLSTPCLAGGANVTTAANRRATSVVQPGSNSAATAPCTPVDSRLAGWAYTGSGSVAFTAGQSLPATLTSGSTVTLFAKWETVYGLSASSSSVKFRPGGSAVVTFTATVNGAPAPGREVALSTSGDPVSVSPGPSVGATTDAAGKVSVTIAKRFAGEATVTASFGDRTAIVDISAVDSATIDITGDRGTVAGKSGIIVNGTTTGFTAGDTVVPYVRFPGQEYTQGSARPEIAADGSFEWQRKTGKKTYVYFTSADGTVTSNRIIIAAQ